MDPRVARLLPEPQPRLETGGGANERFRNPLTYFPATGQGVAIMTNSDAIGALQVASLIAFLASDRASTR